MGATLGDWLRVMGVLGAEIGLLGLVLWALAAGRWRDRETTAAWPRMWWRGGVLGVFLMAAVEVSGARGWLGAAFENFRRSSLGEAQVRTNLDPTLSLSPMDRAAAVGPARSNLGSRPEPFNSVIWPAVGWLAGAAAVLGRMLWARGVFAWVLYRRARPVGETTQRRLQRLSGVLGVRRRVRLRCLDVLPGPVTCGLIFPSVVVPNDFEDAHGEVSQDAMLMHELAHVSARDAVWHGLADFAAALLWWHPAVWWMRRRLLAASELAADESCRAVQDGPRVLAECLVVMARRWVSSSPVAGWQGVHGGRFRSGLGRRVERLLEDEGSAWRPLSTGQRWLGRVGLLLLLGGIAVAGAALVGKDRMSAGSEMWRWSLSQILVVPGSSAESAPAVESELEKLVTSRLFEARALYAAGLLTEAEAKFRAVLNDEPRNPAAKHYLELIESKRPASVLRPARAAALNEQLDSIVLESFGGTLPLGEMALKLFELGKAADPQGRGINIVVNPGVPTSDPMLTVDPATGLPIADLGATDLRLVTVQIQPALAKVTVRQALQAMMRGAGGLLRFDVADYGVVISAEPAVRTTVAEALHTRWFRLSDPIKEALAKRTAPDPDEVWLRGVTREQPGEVVLRQFRSCLKRVGLTFPPPVDDRNSGRSIFYADRKDMLMVRATLQELDLVEQVIQELNTPMPQVVIEARFAEVPAEGGKALGLDWLLGDGRATNSAQGWGLPTNDLKAAVGVLTPTQTRVVLRAMEQRRGVNLMTSPKITTLSGRQAQVKVVNVRYLVTEVKPAEPAAGGAQATPLATPFEAGPVLDVVPTVMFDRTTVRLSLAASVKEFIGYDPTAPESSPRPVYRERSMTAPVTVWDGQTVVLFGGEDRLEVFRGKGATGAAPAIGREFQEQHAELRAKTKLAVFVSVRLIDPNGEPIRSEENLPPGVPPQTGK